MKVSKRYNLFRLIFIVFFFVDCGARKKPEIKIREEEACMILGRVSNVSMVSMNQNEVKAVATIKVEKTNKKCVHYNNQVVFVDHVAFTKRAGRYSVLFEVGDYAALILQREIVDASYDMVLEAGKSSDYACMCRSSDYAKFVDFHHKCWEAVDMEKPCLVDMSAFSEES